MSAPSFLPIDSSGIFSKNGHELHNHPRRNVLLIYAKKVMLAVGRNVKNFLLPRRSTTIQSLKNVEKGAFAASAQKNVLEKIYEKIVEFFKNIVSSFKASIARVTHWTSFKQPHKKEKDSSANFSEGSASLPTLKKAEEEKIAEQSTAPSFIVPQATLGDLIPAEEKPLATPGLDSQLPALAKDTPLKTGELASVGAENLAVAREVPAGKLETKSLLNPLKEQIVQVKIEQATSAAINKEAFTLISDSLKEANLQAKAEQPLKTLAAIKDGLEPKVKPLPNLTKKNAEQLVPLESLAIKAVPTSVLENESAKEANLEVKTLIVAKEVLAAKSDSTPIQEIALQAKPEHPLPIEAEHLATAKEATEQDAKTPTKVAKERTERSVPMQVKPVGIAKKECSLTSVKEQLSFFEAKSALPAPVETTLNKKEEILKAKPASFEQEATTRLQTVAKPVKPTRIRNLEEEEPTSKREPEENPLAILDESTSIKTKPQTLIEAEENIPSHSTFQLREKKLVDSSKLEQVNFSRQAPVSISLTPCHTPTVEQLSCAGRNLINYFNRSNFKVVDGIFRVSASYEKLQEFYPYLFSLNASENLQSHFRYADKEIILDGEIVAGTLKKIYRELSLFGDSKLRKQFIKAGQNLTKQISQQKKISMLQKLIERLSEERREDLRQFIFILHQVSQEHAVNRMPASNLAKALNDTLCPQNFASGKKTNPKQLQEAMNKINLIQAVTEFLIAHYPQIFTA